MGNDVALEEAGARIGALPYVYGRRRMKAGGGAPQKFIPLPQTRRGWDRTGGIACVESVLRYAGFDFDTREDLLHDQLCTSDAEGATLWPIVQFLSQVRHADETRERMMVGMMDNISVEELKEHLADGRPVICLLQAWRDGEPKLKRGHDYTNDWEHGHFAVAVGYDEQNVYFMDPAVSGNYTYVPYGPDPATSELDKRWHAMDPDYGECDHTGLILTICRAEYDPSLFFKML